jgi:hypothetical protein
MSKLMNKLITPWSLIGKRLRKLGVGYRAFTNYAISIDTSGKYRFIFKYLGLGFFYYLDTHKLDDTERGMYDRRA